MTFTPRLLLGRSAVLNGGQPIKSLVPFESKILNYVLFCHTDHALELLVAIISWFLLYPSVLDDAKGGFAFGWIAKIMGFTLAAGWACFSFWHVMMYGSEGAQSERLRKYKFNKENQYESWGTKVGLISSSSGQLQREVFYTTVGLVISGLYQVVVTWAWATGRASTYLDFWSRPYFSVGMVLLQTYWRLFHFYWVHRMIHPWSITLFGKTILKVDFLYTYVHKLHHLSTNPGPWAGLSMHPVEHIIYYTCTLLPVYFGAHPLAFLYNKFHCDISPVGGHDGYTTPGGSGSGYHWLHHHAFECNYGVPLVDFDSLFGTLVEYDDWVASGRKYDLKIAKQYTKDRRERERKEAAAKKAA